VRTVNELVGNAIRNTYLVQVWVAADARTLRSCSDVTGRFLDKLDAGAQAQFGVDVGEVGLHGAR
jgi:hypothetical protein